MSRTIELWAPAARRVSLVVGGRRRDMRSLPGGRWTAAAPPPGADYGFSLDGGAPLPDPRSPWQPRGPFGLSRALAPGDIRPRVTRWRTAPWPAAVLYELHAGTFTPEGTLDAAAGRLEQLAALGVTHVQLMPVVEFPGRRGWGYDGVFPFAPYSGYGGPRALRRFIDACHARSLGVILDVVFNHLGPAGNFLARFGPYFTDRYRTPWGEAVNLDGPGSDEVRRYWIDNARQWLAAYGADGLRLDAVHALCDASALHFLEELAQSVRALERRLRRPLLLLAESDRNDPRLVRPARSGGYGLDAQFNEDFHHALHAALTGERNGYFADFGSLAAVTEVYRRGFYLAGRYSVFRGRRHGRPADGLGAARFVAFLQNHDQVGNRARGERSARLMSRGRLKVGAALLFFSPFVPSLFQGEEWGAGAPFLYFTDHEPALGRLVTRGRRREFAAHGWPASGVPDPQDESSFLRSKLDWTERARAGHAELLAWHRALIALRRRERTLRDGRLERVETRSDEGRRWLLARRGPLALAASLAGGWRRVPLPGRRQPRVLLASRDGIRAGASWIRLPPDSVAIVRL